MTSYLKFPWTPSGWINCSFICVPKGVSSYICKSTDHIALELFAYLCPFWAPPTPLWQDPYLTHTWNHHCHVILTFLAVITVLGMWQGLLKYWLLLKYIGSLNPSWTLPGMVRCKQPYDTFALFSGWSVKQILMGLCFLRETPIAQILSAKKKH